ncbi:MAG: hypothetical protein JWO07_616 [Candidatus Saccharibacteria bacterium]|nr:hypothetical protein [Candidatus Saccharibacteria bacterium]
MDAVLQQGFEIADRAWPLVAVVGIWVLGTKIAKRLGWVSSSYIGSESTEDER